MFWYTSSYEYHSNNLAFDSRARLAQGHYRGGDYRRAYSRQQYAWNSGIYPLPCVLVALDLICMKKIGRGWQYTVYDIGKGRVLKQYNSRFVSYLRMLHDLFPYTESPFWVFPRYYNNCRRHAQDSLRWVSTSTMDLRLFGNPLIYQDGLTYEQDRVVSLRRAIKQKTLEQQKELVDIFVAFNKKIINHGVIDKSFNFCSNFGISEQGEMVLADIGELLTTSAQIKQQIKLRVWAKWYVLNKLPRNLNTYFIEQMDQHILPLAETL